MAQTSTLGSNLQLGGFGNPMGFTPPQPRAGINAQPQDVARLPADNIDRSILSQGVPPFPAGAQATIAQPEVPATSRAMTGELRGTDYVSGGRTPVQTRYGTIYATESQMGAAQQLAQAPPQMTFEQRLADMREKGAAIGERLAGEQTQRYYAFRQGLEEDRLQRAMSQAEKEQARGRSGREAMRIAEQARYGGEIMRQAGANVGTGQRTPFFSWERASMPSGEQFYRGSMGQYSRVAGTGSQFGGVRGGPQPAAATPTAPQPSQAFNLMTPTPTLSSPQSSLGGPSYSGFNLFDPLRGIYGV